MIFTKATETLPPESADWRQLRLEEEEVTCLNFLVKNADSVTPNCKLISFSVVEGKTREVKIVGFVSKLNACVFPCEETSCQRVFFLSCLKSCNGKENILADFFPISSDT